MLDSRITDEQSRRTIREELLTDILVEAGAGSGKTQMLAERMAAGVVQGVYQIEHMAAVRDPAAVGGALESGTLLRRVSGDAVLTTAVDLWVDAAHGGDPVGERGAFDQFQDQRLGVVRLLDAVNAADVGMVQGRAIVVVWRREGSFYARGLVGCTCGAGVASATGLERLTGGWVARGARGGRGRSRG